MEIDELKKALERRDTGAVEKALLSGDLKPGQRLGRDGFTLHHWACYYGQTEVLQKLLLLRADVTAVENHSWTAGHICAIRGQAACLQLLLSHGADITQRDHRGYTCGHLSAAHGNTYTLQVLLKAGMDCSVRDQRGWSACHHAAFHGRYGSLQLLAKWQADLMSVDDDGNLPAHLAAAEGHVDCLRLLVYHDHSPLTVVCSRNNNGLTPKQLAIQFQKQDCADFLASAEVEAQVEETMGLEDYPAHFAAHEGNLKLLKVLIQEGHCTVDDRDAMGATPAHQAAGSGQTNCLQWLIDHGANVSLQNKGGETPLDVAKKYTQFKCVSLLGGTDQLETEEGAPETLVSLDQAKERMSSLVKLLEAAKSRYQELGGVLEEEVEQSKPKRGEDEGEIASLKCQLELERERREELEREADELRKRLHQANLELLHRQLTSQVEQPPSPRVNGGTEERETSIHSEQTGGAYFKLLH